MKRIAALLLVLVAAASMFAQVEPIPRASLAFKNVTVINMKDEQPMTNMTVIVSGGEKGKLAELILLDANPLLDISNTTKYMPLLRTVIFIERVFRKNAS